MTKQQTIHDVGKPMSGWQQMVHYHLPQLLVMFISVGIVLIAITVGWN